MIMIRSKADGGQNVEVSIKLPSEKTPLQQLEIMEAYSRAYRESKGLDKAFREVNCLKVIFPTLFRNHLPLMKQIIMREMRTIIVCGNANRLFTPSVTGF